MQQKQSSRPRLRKAFFLEGETVTMRYVKQLLGEERYKAMIENARERFFKNPAVDLEYPTSKGMLTIWIQVG